VAFDELGMTVVDACAMPENTASIGIMRKCGMTWRGRFRHPRAPIDVEHYATDRAGFEAALRA
jgi:RimJ/RimL family protein N-acetyltransferase